MTHPGFQIGEAGPCLCCQSVAGMAQVVKVQAAWWVNQRGRLYVSRSEICSIEAAVTAAPVSSAR
jgi:hypothetical protein